MDKKSNKDVQGNSSSHSSDNDHVEDQNQDGDNKDINLAALRKGKEDAEAEVARLKSQYEPEGGAPATDPLNLVDDPAPDDKGGEADKKPAEDTTLQKVFRRDVKEAATQFTQSNKVTTAQWAEIKKAVKLTPEMTLTEIKNKINDAYQALPEVKEKRESDLVEKGKREAMGQLHETDMDIPGGGSGGGGEGGGNTNNPRIPRETKQWGKSLGLSDQEMAEVPTEENSGDWEILDPAYKE